MSNAQVNDLAARFTTVKRNAAAEFHCDQCQQNFPSEGSWWRHVNEAHPDVLREPTESNTIAEFRATKGEECKIKNRGRTDQLPAETPNARQTSAARGARPGKGGITKGLETLHLEKQISEGAKAKEEDMGEEDVSMAEASSPVRASGTSRQTLPVDGGGRNTRSRTIPQKGAPGGRSGVSSAARRSKNQQTDPDFDRSLPEFGNRRLYDPSQSPSAFKAEETNKRLENTSSAATHSHAAAIAVGRGQPSPARGKKENRKATKGRGATQPAPESQGLGRELGKHFILRNLGHEQPQHQQAVQQQQQLQAQPRMETEDGSIPENDPSLRMVKQPETRPISGDQLLSEVKGIYAGLVMVEAKCVEVDGKQAAQAKAMEVEGLKPPPLTNEQWQALIALHRTLLHEHHDFFLASQHPSASPALRRLAAKYAMPARMWRHGIHSFLELLRHRLPYSLEHMLTFIYLAYSIMALLYETVPAFEDTWIECLGDLGRYRMAIEDDDIRDREVWTNVARSWYSKAADNKPMVGRLYHHIAILARPNVLQQLFFYCKSLTVGQPFASARESILSLFEPVLSNKSTASRNQPVDVSFVTLHGIWFTRVNLDRRFDDVLNEYLSALDKHIGRAGEKWAVQGCLVAVCNIAALYQYNSRTSKLRQAWREGTIKEEMEDAPASNMSEPASGEYDSPLPPLPREVSSEHATPLLGRVQNSEQETQASVAAIIIKEDTGDQSSSVPLDYAIKMGFAILDLVLQRVNDDNVLPHVHTWMVFLLHLTKSVPAMRLIEQEFPFESLVCLLNAIITAEAESTIDFETDEFPTRQGRPLPEDWTIRGLEFTNSYFPKGWIENAKVDDEERLLELPSFLPARKERILWLGYTIAGGADWLIYDSKTEIFSVHPNLIERIRCHREAAEIRKKEEGMHKLEVDPDTEMETISFVEDEDDIEDFNHPELRELKLKQRELKKQIKTDKPAEEEQETNFEAIRRIPARDALRPNYTVIVVDTNFMLSSLDVFKIMVASNEWSVVIPNTVMTEINGLNSSASVAPAARDAIATIQASINGKKNVRIITAKGNNVTNMGTNVGFYKEKLAEYSEEADMKIDDVIISITESQGKIRETIRSNDNVPGTVQPAVLVTNDRNMRVKATAKHVPAFSALELKAILEPLGQKSHGGRPKRKSAAGSPLDRLKREFPNATEEDIVNALGGADMDPKVAAYTLYQQSNIAVDPGKPSTNLHQRNIAVDPGKPSNNYKKRPKKEQERVAGAG